jgi:hypothetical protein
MKIKMMIKKMIKKKIMMIKKMVVNKVPKMDNKIKYLFSFPFVLSNLNINVNDSDPIITQFAYGVLLISLVAFFCFMNIAGYVIVIYLIQKSDYETKYPKFTRIINYFKKVNLIFLSVEILLCFICLILLIFFSLLFIIK